MILPSAVRLCALWIAIASAGGQSALAASISSALPGHQIGLTVADLLATNPSDDTIKLPVAADANSRPSSMGEPVKAVHIGTNTDLFEVSGVSAAEYWVRYTLDPSSYQGGSYDPNDPLYDGQSFSTPLTGALWVAFRTILSGSPTLSVYSVLDPTPYRNDVLGELSLAGVSERTQTFLNTFGLFFACDPNRAGCENDSVFKLSFFSVANGNLYSSAEGFATLLDSHSRDGSVIDLHYRLAPVPLPAALWLLVSGCIGAFRVAQRQYRI